MKRIIVPTDFSTQATYALDLACEMAKKEESEITLVHIIEIPKSSSNLGSSSLDVEGTLAVGESGDPMAKIFTMKLIERRKEQFASILEDPKYKEVNIVEKLLKGTPYQQISEIIADIKADMIIMGTTGADTWEENLIGSTAEKVVRHSTCPVFTLRNAIHAKDIDNIVLASDFKEDLGNYKNVPNTLTKFFDAKLHLVYINTPGHFSSDREIMESMDNFIKANDLSKITKHIYSHRNAGEGILHFADDHKMDLIMMATSGERSGLFRLFDHSIAEDVVNHSKKPVITLNLHK